MKIKYLIFTLLVTLCQAQPNEESAINELKQLHKRTNFIRDSIGKMISISNDKVKAEMNQQVKESLLLHTDSLWNMFDQNDINELKINIEYCKTHPSSLYSFKLVQQQVSRQSGKNFYYDFEKIYTNSSKEIQESDVGKKMLEQLSYFKKSMVGSIAPNITGVDISSKPFSLIEYINKKYILIDFWASWCGPCREELPFLKSLHEKYKTQGFEIISITTDEDSEKWKKAISNEAIDEWKHFSIFQNNSSAKEDYFVNGIPHKVLIDKNGIIIGKWKASGELNKNELKNQLSKIFGN